MLSYILPVKNCTVLGVTRKNEGGLNDPYDNPVAGNEESLLAKTVDGFLSKKIIRVYTGEVQDIVEEVAIVLPNGFTTPLIIGDEIQVFQNNNIYIYKIKVVKELVTWEFGSEAIKAWVELVN